MNIDIDHLTIKQVREITNALNITQSKTNDKSSILEGAIGKYVIVRSRNEGINAGVVLDADETGIVLGYARRLHYHKPKSTVTSWYEGVAKTGLADGCRISDTAAKKYIVEDYSITICTDEARKSIENYEVYSG